MSYCVLILFLLGNKKQDAGSINQTNDFYKKSGYTIEQVMYVLKDKTTVKKDIYITESEAEYIKRILNKKEIVLSETARLGSSHQDYYSVLNYTEEELESIINCLIKIQPICGGYTTTHGSVLSSDLHDDLIWAYQYENGKEVAYTYKVTDSKELIEILDKICVRKFKEIIDNNIKITGVLVQEYKNDELLYNYDTNSTIDRIVDYCKQNYTEEYPKNDYFRIWLSGYDEFTYIKLPITQEFRRLLQSIGGVIDENKK